MAAPKPHRLHRRKGGDTTVIQWTHEVFWVLNGRLCHAPFSSLPAAHHWASTHKGILVEYHTRKVVENYMKGDENGPN